MPAKHSRTTPYWDNGGRRLLRELTYIYLHRPGPGAQPITISQLASRLDVISQPSPIQQQDTPRGRTRARYQRLRHFLFNLTDAPHSDELMNRLFSLVVPWFHSQTRAGELAECSYLAQVQARRWFDYIPTTKARTDRNHPGSAAASAARFAAEIADMFAIGFDIGARDYEEATEQLTGLRRCRGPEPEQSDQVGFLTYRCSTTPGSIIRSFIRVTPVSSLYPFSWYESFYRYPERQLERDVGGIVVKLGNAIHLLGVVPPHDGVELAIIPCAAGEADLRSGLIASANNGGAPLMSRFVMQRVAARAPDQLKPRERMGILDHPIPANRLPSQEVLWRIRNHIARHPDPEAGAFSQFAQALMMFDPAERTRDAETD